MESFREIAAVRQIPGEPLRRWFSSPDMDLYVWIDDVGELAAFQLCYDKTSTERAIMWHRDQGYRHSSVDDGEGRAMNHKASPMLLSDGAFEKDRVGASFLSARGQVPEGVASQVANRLRTYDPPPPSAPPADRRLARKKRARWNWSS